METRRMLIGVMIVLAAIILAPQGASAFTVTDQWCVYDPASQAYTFIITFDEVPDFETVVVVHGTLRRHHGFQHEVAHVPAAADIDFRATVDAWAPDGCVAIHNGPRPYVPYPGVVFGSVPYEVRGRSVEFQIPTPLFDPSGGTRLAPGDHIYYNLVWFEWGAVQGGLFGECAGSGTSIEGVTWGEIKGMYR